MKDMEHGEWLENAKARKAAAKKNARKPSIPSRETEEKKKTGPVDDQDGDGRTWRGEA
ncbi:MAG: hypothetical protein AAB804_01400 [Patescibacteria group bacterium]